MNNREEYEAYCHRQACAEIKDAEMAKLREELDACQRANKWHTDEIFALTFDRSAGNLGLHHIKKNNDALRAELDGAQTYCSAYRRDEEARNMKYIRRARNADPAIQWLGDNAAEIAVFTHLATTVSHNNWLWLRTKDTDALICCMAPNSFAFYGEDTVLRFEKHDSFHSKYVLTPKPNFCSACGKRLSSDLSGVHTCTPPT